MKYLLAILMFVPVTGFAQGQNCNHRDAAVQRLATKYGESRQAIGMTNGQVVEIFASEETGTWTITVTSPDGVMCFLASGQAFELLEEPLGIPG